MQLKGCLYGDDVARRELWIKLSGFPQLIFCKVDYEQFLKLGTSEEATRHAEPVTDEIPLALIHSTRFEWVSQSMGTT